MQKHLCFDYFLCRTYNTPLYNRDSVLYVNGDGNLKFQINAVLVKETAFLLQQINLQHRPD